MRAAQAIGALRTAGIPLAAIEGWRDTISAVDAEAVGNAVREVMHDARSVTGVLVPDGGQTIAHALSSNGSGG